jgi:hypothetical protein
MANAAVASSEVRYRGKCGRNNCGQSAVLQYYSLVLCLQNNWADCGAGFQPAAAFQAAFRGIAHCLIISRTQHYQLKHRIGSAHRGKPIRLMMSSKRAPERIESSAVRPVADGGSHA